MSIVQCSCSMEKCVYLSMRHLKATFITETMGKAPTWRLLDVACLLVTTYQPNQGIAFNFCHIQVSTKKILYVEWRAYLTFYSTWAELKAFQITVSFYHRVCPNEPWILSFSVSYPQLNFNKLLLIIPPANKVWGGVYWFLSVCILSVCILVSVCLSVWLPSVDMILSMHVLKNGCMDFSEIYFKYTLQSKVVLYAHVWVFCSIKHEQKLC